MFELTGQYATAKVFSDVGEDKAVSQIIELLNQSFTHGKSVRIMPDYHAGAGCVIGFTAELGEIVIPNLVGVDIGCGMHVTNLGKVKLDLRAFDNAVHTIIPSGHNSHLTVVKNFGDIVDLYCYKKLKKQQVFPLQIGTLGGGNHFIELDKDTDGNIYLVVHSGSRNLGKQVAEYWQKVAVDSCDASVPKDLCYLTGEAREGYLHDMEICQKYASLNREVISNLIVNFMFVGIQNIGRFETIHNYVSQGMIRKGAVSAKKDEIFIVPINMRDGSLICVGKGNEDWNLSAPHGAGRLMGRNVAKKTLDLDEFVSSMKGVYSSTVGASTLDEAPNAYKSMQTIVDDIAPTADIIEVIKPIYNFKATG